MRRILEANAARRWVAGVASAILLVLVTIALRLSSSEGNTEHLEEAARVDSAQSLREPPVVPDDDSASDSIAAADAPSVDRTPAETLSGESSIEGRLKLEGGGAPGVEASVVAIPESVDRAFVADWFQGKTSVQPPGVLVTTAAVDGSFRFAQVTLGEVYAIVLRQSGGLIVTTWSRVSAPADRSHVVSCAFAYGVAIAAVDLGGKSIGLRRHASLGSDRVGLAWNGPGRLLDGSNPNPDLLGLAQKGGNRERWLFRCFVVAAERLESVASLDLTLSPIGFVTQRHTETMRRIDRGIEE